MKRMLSAISVLLLLILLCSSCTTKVEIRFVDQTGDDIVFQNPLPQEESGTEALSALQPTEPASAVPPSAVSETSPVEIPSAAPAPVDPGETISPDLSASAEEILTFYRRAVKRVRDGGAGYRKKTWQSAQVLQMTGIAAVDNFINEELRKRATSEAEAETLSYRKGEADTMLAFPDCTLTDVGQIVSATRESNGENWIVRIVMRDEDTPESVGNSMLGQITDIILFKEEIERNLRETLSAVKDYEYGILYRGFEITCELTKDGDFISLRHHAYAQVHVAAARVLFLTLKNKDASLIMDAVFSDFEY